jgi:hypothetical protein
VSAVPGRQRSVDHMMRKQENGMPHSVGYKTRRAEGWRKPKTEMD